MGVAFVAVAVWSALGVWFPALRAKWGHSRIACGALSCASCAVFFGGAGLIVLVIDYVPESRQGLLMLPIFAGFFLGERGYVIDVRRHAAGAASPGEAQETLRQLDGIWALYVLVLLIMSVWAWGLIHG
jgi:hypothetical protein